MRHQKLPISIFPIKSQCKQEVAIATIDLNIRLEHKHNYSFLPSIDAICGIWKEFDSMLQRRSRLKKQFENVVGRTDGRTSAGCSDYAIIFK